MQAENVALKLADELNRLTAEAESFATSEDGETLVTALYQFNSELSGHAQSLLDDIADLNNQICNLCGAIEDDHGGVREVKA